MAELLSRSLQPAQRATAVAFVLMIAVGVLCIPDSSSGSFDYIGKLLHLTAFSVWIGTQFWVTFVAGLTMLQILPRHIFGEVQSHLFRKYFLTGVILSTVIMVTYLVQNPFKDWGKEEKIQGSGLTLMWISVLLNYLWLEPMTVKFMLESHRYEKEHGKGEGEKISSEVEKNKELQRDETYRSIRSKFFIWHGVSATANLISFAVCGFRLWHLAKNISI